MHYNKHMNESLCQSLYLKFTFKRWRTMTANTAISTFELVHFNSNILNIEFQTNVHNITNVNASFYRGHIEYNVRTSSMRMYSISMVCACARFYVIIIRSSLFFTFSIFIYLYFCTFLHSNRFEQFGIPVETKN